MKTQFRCPSCTPVFYVVAPSMQLVMHKPIGRDYYLVLDHRVLVPSSRHSPITTLTRLIVLHHCALYCEVTHYTGSPATLYRDRFQLRQRALCCHYRHFVTSRTISHHPALCRAKDVFFLCASFSPCWCYASRHSKRRSWRTYWASWYARVIAPRHGQAPEQCAGLLG